MGHKLKTTNNLIKFAKMQEHEIETDLELLYNNHYSLNVGTYL